MKSAPPILAGIAALALLTGVAAAQYALHSGKSAAPDGNAAPATVAKATPQPSSTDVQSAPAAQVADAGSAGTLARGLNALQPASAADPTAYRNDPQQPAAPGGAADAFGDGASGGAANFGSSGGGGGFVGGASATADGSTASGPTFSAPTGMGGLLAYGGTTPSSDGSAASSSSATGGSTSTPTIGSTDPSGTPGTGTPGSGMPTIGSTDPSGTPGTGTPGSGTPTIGSTDPGGTPGTGTPGSGTPTIGSTDPGGTPGTGTPGSGTPTIGSTDPSGTPGTGTPGSGTPTVGSTDPSDTLGGDPGTSSSPGSTGPSGSGLPTTDVSNSGDGTGDSNTGTPPGGSTPGLGGTNTGTPTPVADNSSPSTSTGGTNSGPSTGTSSGGTTTGSNLGRAPGNPFLPSSYAGNSYLLSIDSCISSSCQSNGWEFFDPPVTTGLDFQLVENPPGAPLTFGIVGIQVPTIVGDGVYQLILCQASDGDCDIATGIDITANGGDMSSDIFDVTAYLEGLETTDPELLAEIGVTDPADGISAFGLEGLGSANLDDPDAFVAGLLFAGTVDGSLLITPVETDGDITYLLPPIDPRLPEPSSALALLSGLVGFFGWKRRKSNRRLG